MASFCAEKKVMDAYEKKCESPTRQGMREGVIGGLGFGFTFLVFYFAYALLLRRRKIRSGKNSNIS